MTSLYPNNYDTFRTIANRAGVVYRPSETTRIFAEDIQKNNDAIRAIQQTLGLNPLKGDIIYWDAGQFANFSDFYNFNNLITRVDPMRIIPVGNGHQFNPPTVQYENINLFSIVSQFLSADSFPIRVVGNWAGKQMSRFFSTSYGINYINEVQDVSPFLLTLDMDIINMEFSHFSQAITQTIPLITVEINVFILLLLFKFSHVDGSGHEIIHVSNGSAIFPLVLVYSGISALSIQGNNGFCMSQTDSDSSCVAQTGLAYFENVLLSESKNVNYIDTYSMGATDVQTAIDNIVQGGARRIVDIFNPTLAPNRVGDIWINITSKKGFLSVGTDTVNDWILIT